MRDGELTVPDKVDRFVFIHSLLVRSVTVTVDICRSRACSHRIELDNLNAALPQHCRHTSDRPRLSEDTTSQRNVVHLSALLFIPSCDDDTGGKSVLVLVTEGLEQRGDGVYRRTRVVLGGVELGVVVYDVCYGLQTRM
jgi:hypothetical protein